MHNSGPSTVGRMKDSAHSTYVLYAIFASQNGGHNKTSGANTRVGERWSNEVACNVRRHDRCLFDLLSLRLLLLVRQSLPPHDLNEFSGGPAFVGLARATFPSLHLGLQSRIDFHARVRAQLAHHRHYLVLVQVRV
jgi:hypothetical protein